MRKFLLWTMVLAALLASGWYGWQQVNARRAIKTRAAEFFAAISSDDYDRAHGGLSTAFRVDTSPAQLQQFFLSRPQLGSELDWQRFSIRSTTAEATAVLRSMSGAVSPFKSDWVKEAGSWRMYAIYQPLPGLRPAAAPDILPGNQGMQELLIITLSALAGALDTGDFLVLYQHIAPQWRRQTDVIELAEQFSPLGNSELDLWQAIRQPPIFDPPPMLDDDNLLILQGSIISSPERLGFRLRYSYAHLGWQPVSIELALR